MKIDSKLKTSVCAAAFALAAAGCADTDTTGTTASTDSTYDSTDYAMASDPGTASSSAMDTNAGSSSASLALSDTNSISGSSADTNSAIGSSASSEQASASSSSAGQISAQSQSELENYIDFKVVDQQGQEVGKVDAFWEDESGNPAFIAVSSGQGEQVHVIPAANAAVSEQSKKIRVAYSQQAIQSAPQFEKEAKFDQQKQQQVRAHFQQNVGGQSAQAQSGASSENEEASIRLKEEQVNVGTRAVDAGGIVLRKIVRTDTVSKPVELQHEEIVIERVPGNGQVAQGDAQFGEREIFIPLRKEVPVVQKEAVVKEVVNVGKKTEEEQRKVQEQVREEELQIQERAAQDGQTQVGAPAQSESGSSSQDRPTEDPTSDQ